MTTARAVLHVDMDAFYASVEQRDDPRLAGRPVVVGGTGARGVVAAASYEVRRFGVRSAMPMRRALALCPHAVCVQPRMARYQEVSRQVFAIFRSITPLVEGLSLDEAFLDVTASAEAPAGLAVEVKRRIFAATGLTASVGAGPNRLVAKIASELEKPDGLTLIAPQDLNRRLDPLPVRRLPGLGGSTGARVEAAGILNLGQLRHATDAQLWPIFGRFARRVRERAAGIDDRPVTPVCRELSISAEDTFERDLPDGRELRRLLSSLADKACERLRRRDLAAGCVAVKIREHDFTTFTRQRAMHPPTADRRTVGVVAAQLLEQWLTGRPGAKLRLLGVTLRSLSPAAQLALFFDAGVGAGVNAAVDAVQRRFGTGSLRRASSLRGPG